MLIKLNKHLVFINKLVFEWFNQEGLGFGQPPMVHRCSWFQPIYAPIYSPYAAHFRNEPCDDENKQIENKPVPSGTLLYNVAPHFLRYIPLFSETTVIQKSCAYSFMRLF